MAEPRILLFDIETFPNESYTWGKWEQNVIAFKKEWSIASFAWKFLGEKSVGCLARSDFKCKTDKELTRELHRLFKEADVLIAHNGDQFDVKKTNARFIFHGFPPPKIATQIDTKKIAKRYFSFNSNSLDDLGRHLKIGRKIKHAGFELWEGCMRGCKKSWNMMKRYNIQDVLLLEKVYLKMRPWIHNHPNMSALKGLNGCPNCGLETLHKKGFRANSRGMLQQWQCQACGGWFLRPLKRN